MEARAYGDNDEMVVLEGIVAEAIASLRERRSFDLAMAMAEHGGGAHATLHLLPPTTIEVPKFKNPRSQTTSPAMSTSRQELTVGLAEFPYEFLKLPMTVLGGTFKFTLF